MLTKVENAEAPEEGPEASLCYWSCWDRARAGARGLSVGIEPELGARSLSSGPNSKARKRFQTEAPIKVDDRGFALTT